jgi:hypothetical protein
VQNQAPLVENRYQLAGQSISVANQCQLDLCKTSVTAPNIVRVVFGQEGKERAQKAGARTPASWPLWLEVEADFRSERARRHVVRAAER